MNSENIKNITNQAIEQLIEALKAGKSEAIGWHGFKRGMASNLYELGASEKVVQRVRRHTKPHVTKERYIRAFDPAVLAAMKNLRNDFGHAESMFSKCSAGA